MSNRLLLINPVSGSGKALEIYKQLAPILNTENISKVIAEQVGHIYELAMSSNLKNFDSVILIGGDGTMHEFINGMMDRSDGMRIPVGLIPAGTGNSLMHDLKALEPEKALKKILKGDSFKMDIAKVTYQDKHIYAFNVVGWGFPSEINQKAEKLKFFGSHRYNLASLIQILRNPYWPMELRVDGKKTKGKYSFFLACNTIHTGKGMKIAPDAILEDGLFDLILLKKASRIKLVRLFTKIFKGSHIKNPLVEHHQSASFSLSDELSSILMVDGQVVGRTPFEAKVLKQEIEILGNLPKPKAMKA